MPNSHEQELAFSHRLNGHPLLRARVESLPSVVEDVAGGLEQADAAERRVIEERCQLGNEALTAWAQNGATRCAVEAPPEPGETKRR